MQLIVNHVSYLYDADTNNPVKALDDVNIIFNKGEFVGLIGHTGSGKSTLVQHLNALVKPTSGSVYYEGEDIFDKKYDRRILRSKIGLVFQYPEHQLFAETVFEDVCFGPKNMGLGQEETEERAYDALKKVGLSEDYYTQSPFNLSGGQKRRVAIAGVLAMNPEILILDEPAAGLDPKSKDELLHQILKIREQNNTTIILVSHNMDDVAENADRIIVLDNGRKIYDDKPEIVFREYRELEKIGLKAPEVTYFMHELKAAGIDVDADAITLAGAKESILKALKG